MTSGSKSGDPMGGEIARLRTPRFLPKLPNELVEEARLRDVVPLMDMGDGLESLLPDWRGEAVFVRNGKFVSMGEVD